MKSNYIQIKCYDPFGRLWVSRPLQASDIFAISNLFFDAKYRIGAKSAFVKQGSESRQVSLENMFTGSRVVTGSSK